MLPTPPLASSIRRDLDRIVTNSANDADRVAYARDMWPRQQIATRRGVAAASPPALIAWPESPEQVAEVVRYAADRGIRIVPYGAGSGVCGGIQPTPESIVLDMKRMRAVTKLDRDLRRVEAGAGIVGQNLEDYLEERGFTLGHFPSSIRCSTLGGWLAGRSAGQCSGYYGKVEDMVERMTVVDGRGQVHRVERGGENAALLPLVVGSEGILGIITDAEMRVYPAATDRRFAAFTVERTEDGLEAIRSLYQAGLRPAVARLYDPFDSFIKRSLKRNAKTSTKEKRVDPAPGLPMRALMRLLRRPGWFNEVIDRVPDTALGGATVVLVWECHPRLAEVELAEAERIMASYGASAQGTGPAEHWLKHRHDVSYRQSPMLAAGAFIDTMEVAAPWSRMLPMYRAVREALGVNCFVMAHFSHAYPDGASIYFTMAGSAKDDRAAEELYDATWARALEAVVRAGGSLSHHHGVGRSKAPAMRAEQGHALDVVRALKATMDPANILNPGVLLGPGPREVA